MAGNRPRTPLQQALTLLTRREHSRSELTRKLRARGCSADEIEQTLARLVEQGWQSDPRFAEALIRHRAASGYGPRWIRAELGTHGLDDALIESALAGFEGDWSDLAWDLLTRRGLAPSDDDDTCLPPARRRKAMELLMRRGFERETMDSVLNM